MRDLQETMYRKNINTDNAGGSINEGLKAEVERLKMELNEQYVDENDTTWRRPSYEAYYLACKARRKAEAEVERLQTELALLRKVADAARAAMPAEQYQYSQSIYKLEQALAELDKDGEASR